MLWAITIDRIHAGYMLCLRLHYEYNVPRLMSFEHTATYAATDLSKKSQHFRDLLRNRYNARLSFFILSFFHKFYILLKLSFGIF